MISYHHIIVIICAFKILIYLRFQYHCLCVVNATVCA